MPVKSILEHVLEHEIHRSVEIFAPELVLCVTVVLLLLWRMFELHKKIPSCWIALFGSLLAFFGTFAQFMYLKTNAGAVDVAGLDSLFNAWQISAEGVGTRGPYFTGLLMHDHFSVFFRLGLSLFLILVTALTILTGIPDSEDGQDFYTLLIGSTIGMLMAVGANHLLMLFVAVEMMSVPSYVMVAFQKGRRQATEAALKYVVYGAGIAGVMLYGISLIAGLLGTAEFPELSHRFMVLIGDSEFSMLDANSITLVLGIMMVLIGLAFKLSLVPFHFWCPDAFEGASAEVCGFLSVASKAAAFALLVRFVMAFEALNQLCLFFGIALGVISIITMTLGNLAAYTQTNIKRLLAYSTIAHAGYMVMAVSALLVVLNTSSEAIDSTGAAVGCVEGLMYYIAVYLFMNLTAFAAVALLRNETFSEEIEDYKGIFNNNTTTKIVCICLAISFFSLVGMPPFGGFFAKMMIFYSALLAGNVHWFLWVVLAFGGLNTVFSLFYYLKVLKAIFISEPATDSREVAVPGMAGAYVLLVTLPILALGMTPLQGDLSATAQYVAEILFK